MTSNGEEIEEEEISRIEKGQAKNCHGGIETVICTSPSIVCLTQKVKIKKQNVIRSYNDNRSFLQIGLSLYKIDYSW